MMNITLPARFFYKGKAKYPYSTGYAKIEDNLLVIHGNVSFNDLMYSLTYCLKGKNCYYCGKECSSKSITLDHVIPRDFGGPTIPNNLVPSCQHCNNMKSNMSVEDFKIFKTLSSEQEKQLFRQDIEKRQESLRHLNGFSLPLDWYDEHVSLNEIMVSVVLSSMPIGKKDADIHSFYRKYHHFKSPILVDKNGYLLVGFKTLFFAKNNGISKVPVIVLENVERRFKKK